MTNETGLQVTEQEDELAATGDEPTGSVSKKRKVKPVKSEPTEKQLKGQ